MYGRSKSFTVPKIECVGGDMAILTLALYGGFFMDPFLIELFYVFSNLNSAKWGQALQYCEFDIFVRPETSGTKRRKRVFGKNKSSRQKLWPNAKIRRSFD